MGFFYPLNSKGDSFFDTQICLKCINGREHQGEETHASFFPITHSTTVLHYVGKKVGPGI